MKSVNITVALAAALALFTGDGAAAQNVSSTQAQREKFSSHAIGLNMAFYEAQRAGNMPTDSKTLFPYISQWKLPGYTDVCSDYVSTLAPADQADVDFPNNAGYYEAGNAVLVTGPLGFTAVQMAIGALQFMPMLERNFPVPALGDPAGCIEGGFVSTNLKQLFLRQIRYVGSVLSNAIMVTRADNSEFSMLIGVADSSTYGGNGPPSWLTPPEYQEKCYIADMEHPAADIAGQAAAGLAMVAKVSATYGNAADVENAKKWGIEAARTYEYAKLMWRLYGPNSTCTASAASENCQGSGCTTKEDDGDPVRTPCILYINNKPADQYIFVAAAALYALTGDPYYRHDADSMFPTEFPELQIYLYNWNNVVAQGVVVLSMAPDLPGAARPRDFYRRSMRTAAAQWSQCSNTGEAVFGDYTFCKRTEDGSAYPLAMPWGNLGTIMNGVCMTGIYQTLGYDAADSPIRKSSACFMQRQLGYIFNHKCDTAGSSCNTADAEGFSYMVGLGSHWPTRTHSRDAAYPNFREADAVDESVLCGALVAGPYSGGDGEDGAVTSGTDMYSNDRTKWRESEPAVDYTSSLVCALMSYASMPDALFAGCPARTPFTGRTVA